MKTKAFIAALPLIAAISLTACSGGGGNSFESNANDNIATGGTGGNQIVTALKMPSTLSVLAAEETTTSPAPGIRALVTNFLGASRAISGTFASTSDYEKARVDTYVYDASMQPLQSVNMILCLLDQMRANDLLNKGPYIALVDMSKCDKNQSQTSSAQTSVVYTKWTVISSRASNSSPQIVKIWFEDPGTKSQSEPMESKRILVEVTVNEGVSAAKPYGSFTVNFTGTNDLSSYGFSNEQPVMNGMLRTVANADGKPQFEYIEFGGDPLLPIPLGYRDSRAMANVIMNSATDKGGQAHTLTYEFRDQNPNDSTPGQVNTSMEYALDFNTKYVLRGAKSKGSPQPETCLDRTNFNTQIWRYGVYHAMDGTFMGKPVTAGQEVALDSGFPFTYNGNQGNVGYWGMWYEDPNPAAISAMDNQVIDRVTDYATNSVTKYKVYVAPGKLTQRTSSSLDVTKLQGVQLYYWAQDLSGSTTNNLQYLVTVDSKNDFIATGTVSNDRQVTTLASTYNVTPTQAGAGIWLWSDALNGSITYINDPSVTDPAFRKVTFYKYEFLRPDSAPDANGVPAKPGSPVILYCYYSCLKGGLDQVAVDAMGNDSSQLYYPSAPYNGGIYTGYAYTVTNDGFRVILVDEQNGKPVRLDRLNLSAFGNNGGSFSTGEMIAAPTVTDWWRQVYSASPTYRWETGSSSWSKMVVVENQATGVLAKFDRPLQFSYTHATAYDLNNDATYDGKLLMIQYGGPGQLWGFPWVNDPATNRWSSTVTLRDKVELTDGTNTFVVKGIGREQRMVELPHTSACTSTTPSLSVTGLFTTLPLPNAIFGDVSFDWAAKPAPVTTNKIPAVIGGVVQ